MIAANRMSFWRRFWKMSLALQGCKYMRSISGVEIFAEAERYIALKVRI